MGFLFVIALALILILISSSVYTTNSKNPLILGICHILNGICLVALLTCGTIFQYISNFPIIGVIILVVMFLIVVFSIDNHFSHARNFFKIYYDMKKKEKKSSQKQV